MKSFKSGLSREEKKTETIAEHLCISNRISPLCFQHVVEVVITLIIAGLLLFLCNCISQGWLIHFNAQILKSHTPV